MEFKNMTPFDAIAFDGVDTKDREYHVVVLAASYTLRRVEDSQTEWAAIPDDGSSGLAPLALTLGDEHWGDPTATSLVRESDLVPYKPRCDVRWIGYAHAGQPAARFTARLAVRQGADTLIDKSVLVTGPCQYERFAADGPGQGSHADPSYRLGDPLPVEHVALRYELAFGGNCKLASPDVGGSVVHEVCFRNPLGRGWMEAGYLQALKAHGEAWPDSMPAPQIWADYPATGLTVTAQSGSKTAVEMAAVDYPVSPAGFGALGKAWAPRLQLAGTYDDEWLAHRHPDLPLDFDFGFWNGAPSDLQMPFPDVTSGLLMAVDGLTPDGQRARWRVPQHRAFVIMRLDDGLVLPNPMQIDLIEVDNSDLEGPPRLRIVWRTAVLQSVGPRVLEARFETDPMAPLLKLDPSPAYVAPSVPTGTQGS